MKVSDLVEALRKMPPDAEVIVGMETVDGIELVKGRLAKEGDYFGTKRFVRVEEHKARDSAVMFTRLTEYADGSVDQGSI